MFAGFLRIAGMLLLLALTTFVATGNLCPAAVIGMVIWAVFHVSRGLAAADA